MPIFRQLKSYNCVHDNSLDNTTIYWQQMFDLLFVKQMQLQMTFPD